MPRSARPRLLLAAAALLTLSRLCWGYDDLPPQGIGMDNGIEFTDCENNWTTSNLLSTGLPNVRIHVQDANSGLQIGPGPHLGGDSARSDTLLLLHFDNAPVGLDSTTYHNDAGATNIGVAGGPYPAFNNAATFNGGSSFLATPDASSVTFGAAASRLTLQAWLWPNVTDANPHPVIEFSDGVSSAGVAFGQGPNGSVGVSIIYVDTNVYPVTFLSGGGKLTAHAWQLVTFTYSGGITTFYVNNLMVASTTVIASGLQTSYKAFIGRDPLGSGAGAWYGGAMDEVRILSSALTPQEVNEDYYSGLFQYAKNGGVGPFTNHQIVPGDFNPVAYVQGSPVASTIEIDAVPLTGNSDYVSFLLRDTAGNSKVFNSAPELNTGPPNPPANLLGTPLGPDSVLWTWTKPDRMCSGTYEFFDAAGGPPLVTGLGVANYTEPSLLPNALYERKVAGVSSFGMGQLSKMGASYTVPNPAPPGSLQSTFSVTTTRLGLTWGDGGNPAYTRWELNYSADPAFGVGVSTPFAPKGVPDKNHTSTSAVLSGLAPDTTYYFRIRAWNGANNDTVAYVSSASVYAYGAFPTLPSAATMTVVALATDTLRWSWSLSPTATGYTLVYSTSGGLLTSEPAGISSFTLTGLSPNFRVSARLFVDNTSGESAPSKPAAAFTFAQAPRASAVTSVSTEGVSLGWDPRNNPNTTVYQIVFTTDSTFNLFLDTRSTTGSAYTLTGLLPGGTYFIQIRAINGDSIPTAFDTPPLVAVTVLLPALTELPLPPSPYNPIPQAIATWHFDEGGGTRAVDSSGNGNDGRLTCYTLACSTPSYTPSFSGMGTAVSFPGVQNAFCGVPDSPSLENDDSISVEAWVKPRVPVQVSGAGIVAKGGFGDANTWALDASGGHWRFLFNDQLGAAYSVASTQTIKAGRWTFLAGVYDKDHLTLTVYVDGAPWSVDLRATGSPIRGHNSHDVSIGSRQSATNNPAADYDLSFAGLIDEVHLSSRALTNDDVAADFASARRSAVNFPPALGDYCLDLLPNTFPSPGLVLISTDPLHWPLQISPVTLNDGLSSEPTGQTLVPGSLTEVVADIGGIAYTGALASTATLCLPYPDPTGNGLVEGTNPPISAKSLVMYTLDPVVAHWQALPSTVDLARRRVMGAIPHFSVFALFGPSGIRLDTSNVRVYPVPWLPGSRGKFDSATLGSRTGLAFDNLPASGFIRIFTLSAELVTELDFSEKDLGTAVWDGKNRAGRNVASGVYFAYIHSSAGATAVKRFAIER